MEYGTPEVHRMSDKLNATFVAKHVYEPGDEYPCKAVVTIKLPACDGVLDPAIQSAHDTVEDQYLFPNWGRRGDAPDYRETTVWIRARDWDSLMLLVAELKESTVQVLRNVYKKNRQMIETIPKNSEESFVIGEHE